MQIPLDKKKHKKLLLIYSLGTVGLIGFVSYLIFMDFKNHKMLTDIVWILPFMVVFQLFPIAMLLRRLVLMKRQEDCVIYFENGYLTVLNRVFTPVKNLHIDHILSISEIKEVKGNQSFVLGLDTKSIEGNFIKKMISKKIRISELGISRSDLSSLRLALIGSKEKRTL